MGHDFSTGFGLVVSCPSSFCFTGEMVVPDEFELGLKLAGYGND